VIVENNDLLLIPKIKSLHRGMNNAPGGFISIPFGTSISYQLQKVNGVTGDDTGFNPVF